MYNGPGVLPVEKALLHTSFSSTVCIAKNDAYVSCYSCKMVIRGLKYLIAKSINSEYVSHVCAIFISLHGVIANEEINEICETWNHDWDSAEKETFKNAALQAFDRLAINKICKEYSYC